MHLLDTARKRVALLALSAVLAGLGVFFFLQDLGTATNYAGIGTFFVGVVGLAISVATLAVSMRQPSPPTPPGDSESPQRLPGARKPAKTNVIFNGDPDIKIFQTGENSTAIYDAQREQKGHRKKT